MKGNIGTMRGERCHNFWAIESLLKERTNLRERERERSKYNF